MSLSATISVYKRISNINSEETMPLDMFLEFVRIGKWQDIVLPTS